MFAGGLIGPTVGLCRQFMVAIKRGNEKLIQQAIQQVPAGVMMRTVATWRSNYQPRFRHLLQSRIECLAFSGIQN